MNIEYKLDEKNTTDPDSNVYVIIDEEEDVVL